MSKPLLCVALGLAIASTARAAEQDITGQYSAHGVGVDGKTYEAPVTIKKIGDSYTLEWKFADSVTTGSALRQGDLLAVAFLINGKAAIAMYKINGTTLEGQWADGNDTGTIYKETLTHK